MPPPALPATGCPKAIATATAIATPVGGDEAGSAFDPVVSSKQQR